MNLLELSGCSEPQSEELPDYPIPKPPTLFEVFGALSYTKEDILKTEEDFKLYSSYSYMIDRAFSYHIDTVHDALIVSCMQNVPDKMKYHYYMSRVSPRKRFAKFGKPKDIDNGEYIMRYFGWSKAELEKNYKYLQQSLIDDIVERLKPKN